MDMAQVLEALRPGEDWGPCAQSDSTYADLARTWRGASPVPTEAEMQAEWAALVASAAARAAQEARTAAVRLFLTSNDPASVGARALFAVAFTLINDGREAAGYPRVLMPEIVTRAMTAALAGDGDAPQPVPPAAPAPDGGGAPVTNPVIPQQL